ncbi:MAG: ISAzo13 family transposase [Hyphomicrobiales bacterium]|nr:ISAzo13 family transposase [Hyphomicrobiales bacterium]
MLDADGIRCRYEALFSYLDERGRRLFAAAEARAAGHGGIALVSEITGIAPSTIGRGLAELDGRQAPAGVGRVRRRGGGRKPLTVTQPGLLAALKGLVEPGERGDPQRPLRWVSKSYRHLAEALSGLGYSVSFRGISPLLAALGYSLQGNAKTREGSAHPDRDGQFEAIARQVSQFMATDDPVISVDTKKKELVGRFKNTGRELRPKGKPEEVSVHDFPDKELGKAAPYGVYDVANNIGWVNLGISHDTAAFAVESIRRWWRRLGQARYPRARRLLITADCGGSNGARVRLWKVELQKLARELDLEISVCHLPPGTSKWNKIEHRLFSFITQNWRGKPLTDLATIISLIGATSTSGGLKVYCDLDTNSYPKGIKVSDAEIKTLNIKHADFHGEWNYTLMPST